VSNYEGRLLGGVVGAGLGAGIGAWRAGKGQRWEGAGAGILPGYYLGAPLGGFVPHGSGAARHIPTGEAGYSTPPRNSYPPPPSWAPPVRENLSDIAPWLHDATSQAQVKAMFRQKARALHPDMGGSTAAMQRLNEEWQNVQTHPSFIRLKTAFALERLHALSCLRLNE
jgi:hypothetical protein